MRIAVLALCVNDALSVIAAKNSTMICRKLKLKTLRRTAVGSQLEKNKISGGAMHLALPFLVSLNEFYQLAWIFLYCLHVRLGVVAIGARDR